jgi:Zn-dependent peptidase ImmA (M78 family)
MRGAALSFDQLPVIILNGADAPAGRSFTLMHELTHLLLRQGGICDLAPSDDQTPDAKVERFCNAVAAAVLMPASQVLALLGDRGKRDWTLDELGLLAKPFCVSREALLVRLVTLGRASQQHYLALRSQFREEYLRFKQSQRKDGDGGPSPAVMAIRNLGRPFVRLVLDAYEGDRIDLSTVSDYLGVKLRHLPRIRELAGGGVPA